ncbi:MAG: hypothetical protein IAX21_07325 [Candidatus Bathyarchaeota archaeon]|nr:MAG: hypothetical protein IAX21_07325 [Candidatus Bathyarchaeota archaeon]
MEAMPKGKPWTKDQEMQLRELLQAGKSIQVIAKTFGKTQNAIRQKMIKLELEEKKSNCSLFSSTLKLPEEIPSIETVLKTALAALKALEKPGLAKVEVMRLRAIIQSAAVCQVKIAEFIDYARIEAKLIELDEKYEKLVQEKRKNTAT